jgi:hypothetical protein
MVELIDKAKLDDGWRKGRTYLQKSMARDVARMEESDVLELLALGKMQLWLVRAEENVKGAAVTEIVKYPRSTTLLVVYLGGVGFSEWGEDLNRTFTKFCVAHRINTVTAMGRAGLARLLKRYGFTPAYLAVEKRIH